MSANVLGMSGDAKTESRDEQIRGNTGSVIARGNLQQVGAGGLLLRGAASADVIEEGGTALRLGKGARLTINQTSDPALLADVLDSQRASLADLLASQGTAASNAAGATSETLAAVLGKLGDLAESKQTEGESGRDKTIMYIVLALLAVVGLYLWRKRK